MKAWIIGGTFALGVVCGCMTAGPPAPASTDSPPPASDARDSGPGGGADLVGVPLLVDRTDLRLGTTIQFRRLPTASELHDATQLPILSRVVVSLPSWPAGDAPIQDLSQIPEGAELVVVITGYPPTRAATEMWRYVQVPMRMIVVVPGPPPGRDMIDDLNAMPQLERVIAQMDQPSRTGFERLQRPLSFRVVVD